MNLIKKASAALAAASIVAMPVAASAAPAQRVDATVDANSEMRGGGVVLGLIAAALIIAGIIIAVDGQDDDPVSA